MFHKAILPLLWLDRMYSSLGENFVFASPLSVNLIMEYAIELLCSDIIIRCSLYSLKHMHIDLILVRMS